jgi:hypothetical protein
MDSRREENTRIISPENALDLEAVAVLARGPLDADPVAQGFFQVLGGDRADRADVLVVAKGIRGTPLPVRGRPGHMGDLGLDMELHVAVPGGVLQPVRRHQVRLVPLTGFPAVDPLAVRAGAGVAGLTLEVGEARVDRLVDHRVYLGHHVRPVLFSCRVSGFAGQTGVLAEGGVEDRDRLRQRQGQIEEQRALAGLAGGLQAQFPLAFRSGVGLGGQELGVEVGGLLAVAWGPA